MTDEEHNKYIAFSFLAYGAFQLLMLLFMGIGIFFMLSMPPLPGQPAPPRELFLGLFGFMMVFQTVFAAPSFIAAYALLKRKSWARIASIVAGVLSAISVPVGTAACVYSMWFFLGDRWKSVYPEQAEPQQYFNPELNSAPVNDWKPAGDTRDHREFSFDHREPPDWR